MKKLFILLAAAVIAAGGMRAEEHNYVWNAEFPNYKQQIPSSDFTTADGLFRFTSDKAQGVSGPQFNEDKNAGLLLRLYADNTLRIESLSGDPITDITFVIGGNGHYKLANLTPSKGAMGEPYIGKDATDTFREYRLFWSGNATDITFTVGHLCEYGIDCAEHTTASGQGLEDLQDGEATPRKIIYNGQVYILRSGHSYTLTGTEVIPQK